MTRKVQKISEILPARPPSFQPKKQKWFDIRKNCLHCGYLETLSRYDWEETEEGNPSWREERGIVPDRIRREILKNEVDRWTAKDFRCYRGVWDATFGGDIHKRTLMGLEEATEKRTCPLFSLGVLVTLQKPIVNCIESEQLGEERFWLQSWESSLVVC